MHRHLTELSLCLFYVTRSSHRQCHNQSHLIKNYAGAGIPSDKSIQALEQVEPIVLLKALDHHVT